MLTMVVSTLKNSKFFSKCCVCIKSASKHDFTGLVMYAKQELSTVREWPSEERALGAPDALQHHHLDHHSHSNYSSATHPHRH